MVAMVQPANGKVVEADTKGKDFDYSAPPPFTLQDLRNAIPKHCWVKSPWRSVSFFIRDMIIVFSMAAAALYFDSWTVWPLYWIAQGTMFWALFVVGHDCGHGSFSDSKTLNNIVGHLSHAFILVPYHGWRISHRTHHANHGHVEHDESWYPITKEVYDTMDFSSKLGRFYFPFTLFAFPFYLRHRTHHANHGHVEHDESWYPITKEVYDTMDFSSKLGRFYFPFTLFAFPFYLRLRTPGKTGSHFDPNCDLFTKEERYDVLESAAWWWGMIAVLTVATIVFGPAVVFKVYFLPYWVNVAWLDAVTYLHHHGYDKKVPWYRGKEWSYLRGGLSTIDRDYGIFNKIHHDIGTHVVHHLFPAIPHYHLTEATAAVKPILGQYYREPEPCNGPIPFHLLEPMIKSFKEDRFVASEGDIVFYQKQHEL
eukprot:TRINITY_DN5601_c0_g1_i1.p1 TRINITY_DN5601_c0_g1~~TRINITY_DN5601_c0_g1_i1.p1  ORF type:complete len:424 (+),score=28.52 TRINITY_DN5601_c0_g1_i1:80-1351(+)